MAEEPNADPSKKVKPLTYAGTSISSLTSFISSYVFGTTA